MRTAHGVFSLGLLASITQRCYDSGEMWCFSSRCALCERNVGCALLPCPVSHYFRFRLRITSGSGCAPHPVPVAHHIRFQLRIISGSGCACLPVPIALFPVAVAQILLVFCFCFFFSMFIRIKKYVQNNNNTN